MAHNRVLQWATFARVWWIYDAAHQCPHKTSVRIREYLMGTHKPIYHSLSDVGDHVVVFNTRHIAMEGDDWRKFTYHHHTLYGGGSSKTTAWKLHEIDPTKVVYKSVYSHIKGNLLRPNMMRRLHLFPDDEIPEKIMRNVSAQIPQVMPVHKRLDEYTAQEIQEFPKIFDWREEFVNDSGDRRIREDGGYGGRFEDK